MKQNLRQAVMVALADGAKTNGQLIDCLSEYHPAYIVAESRKLKKEGHLRQEQSGGETRWVLIAPAVTSEAASSRDWFRIERPASRNADRCLDLRAASEYINWVAAQGVLPRNVEENLDHYVASLRGLIADLYDHPRAIATVPAVTRRG